MPNTNEPQVLFPQNLPVLYTDAVAVATNTNGVVLNFAQHGGSDSQLIIISRLGMSKENARLLLKAMQDGLEKQEAIEQQAANRK